MNFSPRNQTFFHCFFSLLAHRHLGVVWGGGWGRGARTNYNCQLLLATLIFGCSVTVMCRVMSGWYRPVVCVTYRLSGAGLGVNIQLAAVLYILYIDQDEVTGRVTVLLIPWADCRQQKNHSDVKIQLTGVISLLTAAGSLTAVTLATYQWPIGPIPRE